MIAGSGVVGVLLAAGSGSRMGGGKPLLELHGRSLLQRGILTLVDGGCDRVVTVTGDDAGAVNRAARGVARTVAVPVAVAHNGAWATGQASSVRAGLYAVMAEGARAAVVLPVDLPDVGPEIIARLVSTADDHPDHAVIATYDGVRRNPVLLPAAVLREVIGSLQGDAGARPWLDDHPDQVITVECGDIGAADDLDTTEQIEAWLAAGRG